ncbi:HD domain-containing phosphohydrolase [Modicisalibacter radicis]|uniref:HD domain-containing phosphohydrolase n=1 Tax=Halomonas sp. EAR18 TaxID=2518972 RepID=UPI00109D0914|nr:HD domain-containing phosphohydrolase [Halomonas sp. EAR18]
MESMTETPNSVVEHESEIEALLEGLSQPGDVSLVFEDDDGSTEPVSVLLAAIEPRSRLILDVTAAPEVVGGLRAERSFRLTGQARGAMVSTPPLTAMPLDGASGRVRFTCGYPEWLDVWHRRNAFRAEIGPGMTVAIELDLASKDRTVHGELVNLSLGGCLIRLPLGEAADLTQGESLKRLEAIFPSGQRFTSPGEVRHVQADDRGQQAMVGVAFNEATPRLERQVWFLVKEIERESARIGIEGKSLSPSALFKAPDKAPEIPASKVAKPRYATPMARRLAKVADFLNAEMLLLKQGRPIDSALLSRNADLLLGLLDEDREALLFASVCLVREPTVVQHGLAVAIRLVDLLDTRSAPRELRKAVIASAMVHDLGKALLPESLLASPALDAEQRAQLHQHVGWLAARLGDCRWLDAGVFANVALALNERLDGSGYPEGKRGAEMPELSRMAAVVDAIDAMGRSRADRAAWSTAAIYRHLLAQGQAYDVQWVQRYVRHFGVHPVGSLVRYSSGAVAWIHRLDAQRQPALVHVVRNHYSPNKRIDQWAQDRDIAQLGSIEAGLDPSSEVLSPL